MLQRTAFFIFSLSLMACGGGGGGSSTGSSEQEPRELSYISADYEADDLYLEANVRGLNDGRTEVYVSLLAEYLDSDTAVELVDGDKLFAEMYGQTIEFERNANSALNEAYVAEFSENRDDEVLRVWFQREGGEIHDLFELETLPVLVDSRIELDAIALSISHVGSAEELNTLNFFDGRTVYRCASGSEAAAYGATLFFEGRSSYFAAFADVYGESQQELLDKYNSCEFHVSHSYSFASERRSEVLLEYWSFARSSVYVSQDFMYKFEVP